MKLRARLSGRIATLAGCLWTAVLVVLATPCQAGETHQHRATRMSESTAGEITFPPPPRFGNVPLSVLAQVPALSLVDPSTVRVVDVDGQRYVDMTATTCLAARFTELAGDGSFVTSRMNPPLSSEQEGVIRGTAAAMSRNNQTRLRAWLAIVGHNRSGSTLLGSLLDAHQHILVANELNAVVRSALGSAIGANREQPLNARRRIVTIEQALEPMPETWALQLALRGTVPCSNARLQQEFNYSVPGGWQAAWSGVAPWVMGDKNTDNVVHPKYMANMSMALHHWKLLHNSLDGVPFRYVQVIRNPLDTIITEFLRDIHETLWWLPFLLKYDPARVASSQAVQFIMADARNRTVGSIASTSSDSDSPSRAESNLFLHHVRRYFRRYDRVQAFKRRVTTPGLAPAWAGQDSWLDVFAEDMASDTVSSLAEVCDFIGVPCSVEYLHQCRDVVRPELPVRRQLVEWPPQVLAEVHQLMKQRPLLRHYSR